MIEYIEKSILLTDVKCRLPLSTENEKKVSFNWSLPNSLKIESSCEIDFRKFFELLILSTENLGNSGIQPSLLPK